MKYIYQSFEDQYIGRINKELAKSKVFDKSRRDGYLIEITKIDDTNGLDLIAHLSFSHTELHTVYLSGAINNPSMRFDKVEVIKKWLADLPALFKEYKAEKAELDKAKALEEAKLEKLAKKKAEKEKLEARYKKKVADALTKVKFLDAYHTELDSFYTALGWLAAHTAVIRAELPDFMDAWFVEKFGKVKRTVVSSEEYTEGGYAMKWSLSLSLRVDTVDHIPSCFADKFKGKVLNDTKLIYELCTKYGFKVGTESQDIESIQEYLDGSDLEDFKKGLKL